MGLRVETQLGGGELVERRVKLLTAETQSTQRFARRREAADRRGGPRPEAIIIPIENTRGQKLGRPENGRPYEVPRERPRLRGVRELKRLRGRAEMARRRKLPMARIRRGQCRSCEGAAGEIGQRLGGEAAGCIGVEGVRARIGRKKFARVFVDAMY